MCIIDIFSKHAWVAPLKDKKDVSIVNAFQKILDSSNRKPNKILDIDKLVPVPVELSKLSDVGKNDVVKKTAYDKLVAKINGTDTSAFVLKNKYDTDKTESEKKIPNTSGLVKKTDYNAKITDKEGKIPSISGLATNAALMTVENKIPNISSSVKKKHIMTQKLPKLKRNLLIIVMISMLLQQSLILYLLMLLMQG